MGHLTASDFELDLFSPLNFDCILKPHLQVSISYFLALRPIELVIVTLIGDLVICLKKTIKDL